MIYIYALFSLLLHLLIYYSLVLQLLCVQSSKSAVWTVQLCSAINWYLGSSKVVIITPGLTTGYNYGSKKTTWKQQLWCVLYMYSLFWPHQWQCSNSHQDLWFLFQNNGSLYPVGILPGQGQHHVYFCLGQSTPESAINNNIHTCKSQYGENNLLQNVLQQDRFVKYHASNRLNQGDRIHMYVTRLYIWCMYRVVHTTLYRAKVKIKISRQIPRWTDRPNMLFVI